MTTITEPQQEQRRREPEEELALADLDLTDENARDITGGKAAKQRPMRTGPKGGCDEWGCGTNHNEVVVRAFE